MWRRKHDSRGLRLPRSSCRTAASRPMNSLALSRSSFGAAVLVAPDLTGGHVDGMTLGPGTRRAMQILGVRHLLQAGVCAVAPTRCVLSLEVAVDVVHGATMAAVAVVTRNDSRRRAAGINVLSAVAFALAGLYARQHSQSEGPPSSPILGARNRLAQSICRRASSLGHR